MQHAARLRVRQIIKKILLVMKLTAFMLFIALVQASASGLAQKITLHEKNADIKTVLHAIEQQTGYVFLYDSKDIGDQKVSMEIKDATIDETLGYLLKDLPLEYKVVDKNIILQQKEPSILDKIKTALAIPVTVSGKVTDEQYQPLPGVTVRQKGTNNATITDSKGYFSITVSDNNAILAFSFIGFDTREIAARYLPTPAQVILKAGNTNLKEVSINKGYYTEGKTLTTGDISTVSGADISKQPISDPLAALEGRVPGLIITQSSGVVGSGISVQLRGQSSLQQGSDPLFIIDGVPYSPGNAPLNQLQSAAGSGASISDGMSPFNLINPSDIESIDILKDADATAIYGSRGANGVILITTKQGKAGKTMISANVYTGVSKATRIMDMLNTQQYIEMRKEAFKNDGLTPDASSAPDLFLWDTTRYTDFKKLLIGNTAHNTDAELSLSGGDANTQFLISGGYHKETTVFPTDLGNSRASVHFSLNHTSTDKKLTVNLTTIYSSTVNNLPVTDLTQYINTAPNFKLYDSSGKLSWQEGGVSDISAGLLNANPLAFEDQVYNGEFHNLSSNLQLNYKVINDLSLKISMGYNIVNSDETALFPSTSLDPNLGQLPFSYFGTMSQKSWIIEPQLGYHRGIGKGKLDLLIGQTWQDNSNSGINVSAYDYSSDLLLSSIAAASYTQTTNSFNQYRYDGLYGRLNYNLEGKYIFNLSGRRDGSSRFGPDNRFSDFGAIGAAWVFSEESLIKNNLSFLSFGKLRGSYGITGNDQIGNYKYLDTWTPGTTTYQGTSVLNPTSLYNPNYAWEKNRKAEIGLDLGFFNDRFQIAMDYFNNRSSNQLINYTLPIQTGFSSVTENLNATIQNTGWEFQINSKNIVSANFSWISSLALTIPQNKLLSFPGLAGSSYAHIYVVGQSLSTRLVYHYLGVDPATGIYQFEDVDHNGILDFHDRTTMRNTDPKFYGGFQNNFRYKRLELSVFLEFKKQNGINYLGTLNNVPGSFLYNEPVVVLSRWQNPGDKTNIEKFTSIPGDPTFAASSLYLGSSDAVISDASYIRCKNVSLSYNLPDNWLNKFHITGSRLYVQAQNLFVITKYTGSDPENQNMLALPPLKTITVGIQLTL